MSCGTQLIVFFMSELPAIMWIILKVFIYQSFAVLQGCLEDRRIVSWENIKFSSHIRKNMITLNFWGKDIRKKYSPVWAPIWYLEGSKAHAGQKGKKKKIRTIFLFPNKCFNSLTSSCTFGLPEQQYFFTTQWALTKEVVYQISIFFWQRLLVQLPAHWRGSTSSVLFCWW